MANYQGQSPGDGTENSRLPASDMLNMNLIYRLSFSRSKTALTLNLNFNQNDFSGSRTFRYGPTVGGSQTLLKNRLRLMINTSVFAMENTGEVLNITSNSRFTADWKMSPRQSLNAGFSMISRNSKSTTGNSPSFSEYIGTLAYNYRF
jgi:hypothetical protein